MHTISAKEVAATHWSKQSWRAVAIPATIEQISWTKWKGKEITKYAETRQRQREGG